MDFHRKMHFFNIPFGSVCLYGSPPRTEYEYESAEVNVRFVL